MTQDGLIIPCQQGGADTLTSLSGRQRFLADMAAQLAVCRGDAALCLIDVDNFRFLNTVAGTHAADLALQQIAALLLSQCDDGDLVGRTGDDEFALLFLNCDVQRAQDRAAALLAALAEHQLVWCGRPYTFSGCAGLVGTSPADTAEQHLEAAMAACNAAKETGCGSVSVVGKAGYLTARYHRDAHILTSLQSAISADRLRLYAQEIVSFGPTPGHALEFELLVHMIDAEGVEFPPADIIPAAERHGFIRDLDRWVMKAVLVDNAALLDRNPGVTLSLNLSGQSLADPTLWPYIAALFAQSPVPAANIQFEITETSAISDMTAALAFVQAARAHGCRVALDDFGSGLSSFIYLRTFPVDCIKIDGAFVGNVTDPASVDRAIVTAIVGVARALGLTVVAEHVDSTEILATLRKLGVDKVQGFLISQPRPFRELLEKQRR